MSDRERAACGRKPCRAWAFVQRAARASAHGRRKFIAREACSELGEVHRSIGLQSIDKAPLFRSAKRASDGLSSPSAATTPQGVTGAPWAVPERPGPFQNAPGRSRTRWPFQNALAVPGRASRPRPRQRVAERMRRPRPPQAVPARLGRPTARARRVPERPGRPRTRQAIPERRGRPRTPPRHPGAAGVLERAGAFYGGNPYRTRPYVPGRGARPRTRPSVPVRACGHPKETRTPRDSTAALTVPLRLLASSRMLLSSPAPLSPHLLSS